MTRTRHDLVAGAAICASASEFFKPVYERGVVVRLPVHQPISELCDQLPTILPRSADLPEHHGKRQ